MKQTTTNNVDTNQQSTTTCNTARENTTTDVVADSATLTTKQKVAIKVKQFFSPQSMSVMAILTAVAFILYMFVKFPLPFLFPSFLDIQFSDMPALLGGFALGPVAGSVIIIIKCGIKMFFTSTACVGELADILVGLAYVLPASIIYHKLKSKKSAVIGLVVGGLTATAVAIISNWLFLLPFYTKAYGLEAVLGLMQSLYPDITEATLYNYYLPLAVLPFNILRCTICGLITFFVYKPLSKALHWDFEKNERLEKRKQKVNAKAVATDSNVTNQSNSDK